MSAINNALSELAKKESTTSIEAAVVPKVKTRSPLVWVAGGVTLSLAMSGWAISQGPTVDNSISTRERQVQVSVVGSSPGVPAIVTRAPSSPTKKLAAVDSSYLTQVSPETSSRNQAPVVDSAVKTQHITKPQVQAKPTATIKVNTTQVPEPTLIASVAKSSPASISDEPKDSENSAILIEQVELTPEQLSVNAQGRAQKALDANDLTGALKGYNEALRYTPRNEDVRQKLAILYFGKGDTRKAYELFQSGIKLNINSEKLRLGLSKLLVKADQAEAALSPLIHMPPHPTQEYLAMRAALSQKSQQEDIALESYQKLVEIDSENARWWLGLAIQQERQLDFAAAKQSYQGALTRVGVSSQSQSFVRDRLKIISALEESGHAD